ncbi:SMC-Scp complex subunit ScpB [Rhodoligotrophos ferricapiens]|uniref:SMC-Scp complex subunit ScpB n=1 Tax=Rhodoligotrophos ferricapiens TaxID=3069264 RepID=UPI00315D02CE
MILSRCKPDLPLEQAGDHDNVTHLRHADRTRHLRILEALIFTSTEPVSAADLGRSLPEGCNVQGLLGELQGLYAGRGINLVQVAGKWTFRSAPDLADVLRTESVERRKLSRAAMETLGIIAYHQPVTRGEIEDIRGVSLSKGTLDTLMELGWVRMRGRRRTPGRPVTYGTTETFLIHFGLNSLSDLPGLAELKGAGLLDAALPPDFDIPLPGEEDSLAADEDPLEDGFEHALELELAQES